MGVPSNKVMIAKTPGLNIMDNVAMLNIPPMGMCNSPANPMGMGKPPPAVPTPCPCIPIPVSPWTPQAPQVMVGGKPILVQGSMTMCQWAGQISVIMGAPTVQAK
jgi:hypothetical protein